MFRPSGALVLPAVLLACTADDPLVPLRDSFQRDLRLYKETRYPRPVLFVPSEPGCTMDLFRSAMKTIRTEDLLLQADLDQFLAMPTGKDQADVVVKVRSAAATLVDRNLAAIDALLQAARQSVPCRPDLMQGDSFLKSGPRFAIGLLLSDARLKAERGGYQEALDRCTAALVLSQDMARGALFQDAFSSLMLHQQGLIALATVIEVGRPDERQLTDTQRRLGVLCKHAVPASETFENDLLWWRSTTLVDAELPKDKNTLPVQPIAIEALKLFEEGRRHYRAVGGSTYRDRREGLQRVQDFFRSSANPYVKRFHFELSTFDQWWFGAEAGRRILLVLCDWEIDRLREPSKIPELEPMQDPFDGQPIRGFTQGPKVVIYSVGQDLKDDGGGPGDIRMELRR